jgi:hypothetical protein
LPTANDSADTAVAHFAARGFSASELGALIGAHSTAKQFTTDPSKAGTPLDSTPSEWDVDFYSETIDKTAPFTLNSDASMANSSSVGPSFKQFAASKPAWDAAFAPA